MTETTDYRLILPFTDQSPSFVAGFECGQLWQLMRTGAYSIEPEQAFMRSNEDVIRMMCGHFGYAHEITYHDKDYMFLKLKKGSNLKVIK